jgi:hypothetical protein
LKVWPVEHEFDGNVSILIYISQKTNSSRLMLLRETVAVYCENHTEHINTMWGQNAELLNVNSRWYI